MPPSAGALNSSAAADLASTSPAALASQLSQASLASSDGEPMRRVPSSHKDAVKVLCSYGGHFMDSSNDSFDRVYKGDGTRLVTLEFTPETTLRDLVDQLKDSKLEGADDEVLFHYHDLLLLWHVTLTTHCHPAAAN